MNKNRQILLSDFTPDIQLNLDNENNQPCTVFRNLLIAEASKYDMADKKIHAEICLSQNIEISLLLYTSTYPPIP